MGKDIKFFVFRLGIFENGDPAYFIGSVELLNRGIESEYCYGNVEEKDIYYLLNELSEQVYNDMGSTAVFEMVREEDRPKYMKYLIQGA